MPQASLGPRLHLDGEEEYRAEIKQIIEQAKTLDAQMAAVTASFDKNTTAEEKAAKTSEILAKQTETAQKRVNLLRDMVDKAAAATGENSEATMKWKQALYGAEEQLGKLRQQSKEAADSVEDVSEAMEDSGQQTGTLGDQVSDLAGKLGIQLPDGAKKALNGFDGLSTGAVAKLGAITAAATAVIETVKKLNTITDEAATKADDLLTQSMTTGLSTDMLQQIQYAAPYIDVEASTITSAMSKITQSAYNANQQFADHAEKTREAAAQGKEYEGALGSVASAYDQLGVSVTDSNGELRSNQAIFWDVLEALSQVTNETERDALAQQLLGKGARELAPLMQNLDEAQRLYNEAVEEGFVLNKQDLERLGAVDDAHNKLTQTIERNKDMIAVQWAPANQAAYETLTKLTDGAGKALTDSKLIENGALLVDGALGLFDAVMDLVGAGGKLLDSLPGWLNPINMVNDAMKALAYTFAWAADAAELLVGIMPWNWGSGIATTAMGLNASKGQYSNIQKIMYSGSEYVRYNAGGTDFFQGGGTWVGEAGPEYVQLPRGSRIYSNEQSRALMAGGDTVYNITVANVEELDEIIDWYQSRRIRERMG